MTETPSKSPPVPLPSPTVRNWLWRFLQFLGQSAFVLGFQVRVQGVEKIPAAGGGLLLVNHQSFLDPLFVGVALQRPVSYVARENLFRVPIVGWIIRNTYVMPINRDAASTESIREVVRRMQHGFLVGIFPEGTRTRDGELGTLKPGFIALIRRGGVPVFPVGVDGCTQIMPRGTIIPRPGRVCVVFGDPLTEEELACLQHRGREHELVETARRRIEECVHAARDWRARRTPGVDEDARS